MGTDSRRMLVLTACGGIALLLSLTTLGDRAALVSVAFGSVFALKTTYESLRERQLDVNLLMVLAAIGAVVVGQPREAAILLFLFSLSSALEQLAMAKTENAIAALVKLRPSTALKLKGGEPVEVPIEQIQVGDLVRVQPFSLIPVDGLVREGESYVNEAALSGESLPVAKRAGDMVTSGTENQGNRLDVEATAAAGNTTLDRIVSLVQEAKDKPTSGERLSQWFAATYVIFVLAASLVSFLVRWLALKESPSVAAYQSLILLVALSPCALVISAPAAALSGLAFAARNGILVRGGLALEQAGLVSAVAMDKTGTLTTGKFDVAEVCVYCDPVIECWRPGSKMNDRVVQVLQFAAAAESSSQHPIAVAILDFVKTHNLAFEQPSDAEIVPGKGVLCTLGNERIQVGQLSFFEGALPRELDEHALEMAERGLTCVVLQASSVMAAIGLRDTPRSDSAELIAGFRKLGISNLALMTGDNAVTAQAVAKELGLKDVHAGLHPEDKFSLVKGLQEKGERVMMVGDGVNDAPALAEADLGVAMGGLGNDVAMQAADIVLVQDRIRKLPLLIALGRKTRSIIQANLWFAGGMIALLTIGSMIGKLPLGWAVLGHEGSTALVVFNGLRLLGGAGAARMVE